MSAVLLAQVKHLRIGPGWVLEGDKKVKVPAVQRKAALFLLAEYGTTMVPQYRLAAELEVSIRSMKRILQSLQADGFISRDRRYGGPQIRRADTINLTLGATCGTNLGATCGRKEPTTKPTTEKSLALAGPNNSREETVRILDLTDEGPQGYLEERPRNRPTKKPKAKTDKLNPVILAEYTVYKFRQLQWGTPGAVTAKEYGGHYRRWHHDEGVCYREIKVAVDLFCEEWPCLDIPAGRVFLKQRFDWITKAKEAIYQEELPKKQAASKEMWRQIYADLAVWEADHPTATDTERSAEKAALYQYYRYSPESQYSSIYA